jgi:hypothetical protein
MTMTLWYPNRAQWWVIGGIYVVALLVSVEWTSRALETRLLTEKERMQAQLEKLKVDHELSSPPTEQTVWVERFDPSMSTGGLLTFLVIGGGLAVWRLQGKAGQHGPTKEA